MWLEFQQTHRLERRLILFEQLLINLRMVALKENFVESVERNCCVERKFRILKHSLG